MKKALFVCIFLFISTFIFSQIELDNVKNFQTKNFVTFTNEKDEINSYSFIEKIKDSYFSKSYYAITFLDSSFTIKTKININSLR